MQAAPVITAEDTLNGLHGLRLIDARSGPQAQAAYERQHISGAVWANLERDLAAAPEDAAVGGRHPLPEIATWAETLGRWGSDPAAQVVIYAWVVKQNTLDLMDAIREVRRRLHVDDRRVYLSGISMGGGGTASISWILPRAFAAFGPTAGYYWNSWGKVPDLKGVSYRVVHGALDKIPEEPYDRLTLAEAFVTACKGAGAKVQKVILPGVGHHFPATQVPLMNSFLLGHRNKTPTDWVKARQAVSDY